MRQRRVRESRARWTLRLSTRVAVAIWRLLAVATWVSGSSMEARYRAVRSSASERPGASAVRLSSAAARVVVMA
jgi:hypothetical protein